MKETDPSLNQEQLPPSLATVVKERIKRFDAERNPYTGKTATTWKQEHTRVLRAMQKAGLQDETAEKVAKAMQAHAVFMGLHAVISNVVIGETLVGLGLVLLKNQETVSNRLLEKAGSRLGVLSGLLKLQDVPFAKDASQLVVIGAGAGLAGGAIATLFTSPADGISQLVARAYGSVGEKVVQGVGSIAGTNKG